MELTNRGRVAAIVFEVVETVTFDQAGLIAEQVCDRFGIDPSAIYVPIEGAING